MAQKDFDTELYTLMDRMQAAPAMRYRLQPQFNRLLGEMRGAGRPVPQRLNDLNAALIDEAVEAQFDNLPL